MPTTTLTFKDGTVRHVDHPINPDYPVVGLDVDGRIVVNMGNYNFGLTLCCDAFDKGMEDGVYCRACYGSKPPYDSGVYDPDVIVEVAA